MTELLAEQIAKNALDDINAIRWNGNGAIPAELKTKTYKDTNEIKIQDNKYHYEITLDLQQDTDTESNKDKPCLFVALVEDNTKEILNRCKTYTLTSSHIVAIMLLSLYKEYGKVTKK